MDYVNNRYYSNAYGRFMTPDPATGSSSSNPQSWNKYAYVNGDPVNLTDPIGLYPAGEDGDDDDDDDDGGGGGGQSGGGDHGGPGGAGPRKIPFVKCNPNDLGYVKNQINFIIANYSAASGRRRRGRPVVPGVECPELQRCRCTWLGCRGIGLRPARSESRFWTEERES